MVEERWMATVVMRGDGSKIQLRAVTLTERCRHRLSGPARLRSSATENNYFRLRWRPC